jgi:putative membrane protein
MNPSQLEDLHDPLPEATLDLTPLRNPRFHVREILGRVLACVLWAALVVSTHHLYGEVAVSPTVHTLVGAALALLLVFRTNSSYDRFWEGRRHWWSIINESRNLGRSALVYVQKGAPDLARRIGLWTMAFAHAVANRLRDGDGLGPAGDLLPADETRAALAAGNTPLTAASRITEALTQARDRGVISDYVMAEIDRNVQQLIDYYGGCERIRNTPLPFVYVVHLRRALSLYCFSLPFAIVDLYGWWTIFVTFLAAYVFFGIEEIGVEIENPFGYDANDLPLRQFCQTIDAELTELLHIAPVEAVVPAPANESAPEPQPPADGDPRLTPAGAF